MTYYKQFAEMLGLGLDEDFKLINRSGTKIDEATYRITEDGIYSAGSQNAALWGKEPTKLDYLLSGDVKAVPKPWKPKKGDIYWHYSEAWRGAISSKWAGECIDLIYWKVGNCFKNEEEGNAKGKEIIEQIQKEYEEA